MEDSYIFDEETKSFKSAEKQKGEQSGGFWNGKDFVEIFKFALIALVIVLPVRIFIAQPFIVSGSSMDPTFENGQYIIVDELSYRLGEPKRGDVVIFKFPEDTSKYFIKRIIGLPGETVSVDGNRVIVINSENPSGVILDEPYIGSAGSNKVSTKIGDGEYFVMGDNRQASYDSRFWGALPEEDLIGRAYVRLLPLNKIDFLPGFYNPLSN